MRAPGRRGRREAAPGHDAGERPPRAEPRSGGSPDPIPNSAVKPRIAESTAAPGRGRTGRSARRARFRARAPSPLRGGGLSAFCGMMQLFCCGTNEKDTLSGVFLSESLRSELELSAFGDEFVLDAGECIVEFVEGL